MQGIFMSFDFSQLMWRWWMHCTIDNADS